MLSRYGKIAIKYNASGIMSSTVLINVLYQFIFSLFWSDVYLGVIEQIYTITKTCPCNIQKIFEL